MMDVLIWVFAYLVVAVLTFVGLCRRLEPLDLAAFVTLLVAALMWPITLPRG